MCVCVCVCQRLFHFLLSIFKQISFNHINDRKMKRPTIRIFILSNTSHALLYDKTFSRDVNIFIATIPNSITITATINCGDNVNAS